MVVIEPERQAVVFDMDGVMVDSEPVYFASNRKLFNRLGFEVTHQGYAQFVGLDAARMWTQLRARHRLRQSVPELIRMEIDGMVDGLLKADLVPIPGLGELLTELRALGVPLALASSSAHAVIEIILHKLGLENFFAAIVSGEDVPRGKPAPDIFLRASALLDRTPPRCTVIEDSAHGVQAARTAGMRCIGLQNPGSGRQDLSLAGLVITDFSLENRQKVFEFLAARSGRTKR